MTAKLAVVRALLDKAIEVACDAEFESVDDSTVAQVQSLRIRLAVVRAAADSIGRKKGGQSAAVV